jgi:hypothetical protein
MLISKNDVQGIKTEVELTLTSGKVLHGEMFLCAEQQVLDILNGDVQFLPFEGMDGALSIINKASIAQITQYGGIDANQGQLVAIGN